MAIKASASITLAAAVDVASVWRYYLLQYSTLATPDKPTTNPPGGGWVLVEPAYTDDSTSSLYFCDLTVFSDGTFSYSDVSLSSSYEAAKQAYNKADAAQTAANTAQAAADAKADPMTATAHGDEIAVSDSADAAIGGLVIYGKSEQGGQTTGKNLLPFEVNTPVAPNGVEINILPDGGVKIVGTTTALATYLFHADTSKLNVPAGTYHFLLTGSGTGFTGSNILLQLYTNTGSGLTSRLTTTDGTYTIGSNVTADYVRLRIASGVTCDCVVYPMMMLNSITDTTFEKYTGAMPTPNSRFPSLISSAGMSLGKNLLVFKRGETTTGGVTFSPQPDGSLHISGTTSATIQYNPYTDYTILNIPHGMYRIRISGTGTGAENVRVQMYEDRGSGLAVASAWNNEDYICIVRDDVVANTIRIRVAAGTYDCVVYPMVMPAYTDDVSFEAYSGGPVGTQMTLTCADDAQGTNATHTAIPTPNGLPGIAVSSGGNYTDEDGQQWICDTIDLAAGTYIKRCEMVAFDGSSGWSASTSMGTGITGKTRYIYNGAPYLRPAANTERAIAMCDQYPVIRVQGADDGILTAHTGIGLSAAGTISVYDSQYGEDGTTGFTAWKAMLAARPMHCLFALATPVTTPLTEAQLTALRSLRTRDGTTVLTNDAGADMDLTYATRTGGGSYVEGVRQGLDDDVNRAQNAADAAQAAADAAAATADALDEIFRMWYSFTDEGMSVQKKTADGKPASIWSTLTDNTGFHIRRSDLLEKVFSAYKDRCRVQKLVIGNTMVKPSGNGGMVWVKAPQD